MNRYLGIMLGTLLSLLATFGAWGQTATLMPNAVQQFFDSNGKPLSTGTVGFYTPSTLTPKTIWTDAAESTPQVNPVPLGISGRPPNAIYGSGIYRQIVKDHNGAVIWDALTTSTGGSGGSTTPTVGDGNYVGTVLSWSGIVPPTNYLFADGTAISRTTYSQYLATVVIKLNAICTSGLNTLSGLSDTQSIRIGSKIEVSCMPPGTTVTSVASNTIFASANASVSTAAIATFFPFGNGDGSTTFNVPDLRDLVIAGRGNMGGSARGLLTPTYFGAQGSNALGTLGGQQSIALGSLNFPAGLPTAGTAGVTASTAGQPTLINPAFGGSSVPLTVVQPTGTLNLIVKVLPDNTTLVSSGVASLGGMVGDLLCGTGLICASQTVSVLPPNINHPGAALYASDYGVKCDGTTDDSVGMQSAITTADALNGVQIIMPAGTCKFLNTIYLNKWTSVGGTLTVPGLNITGQAKGSTIIDTRISGGYAIAVNPAWEAAHAALGLATTSAAGGSLATNTYYAQITVNDGLGNEIYVTAPKSFAVTGPTGSITMTLPVLLPSTYTYNIVLSTSSTPANYALFNGSTASALVGNQAGALTAIGGAHSVSSSKAAIWQQANVQDLTISNPNGTANASGILYFKTGYSNVTNVLMKNLTNGFVTPNYAGDSDGSFVTTIDKSKFDAISNWCTFAAGRALEFSNFTVKNTSYNLCGTQPAVINVNRTITSISNAVSNVLTTSAGHGWLANDQIYISGVTGMTLATGYYRVAAVLSSTTVRLATTDGVVIDTTSLGAYTASSGTGYLGWRPSGPDLNSGTGGGGIAWLGLIGTFRNLDFTQVANSAMYFSELGASDNATMENIDFENTYGKGLYAANLVGGTINNSECLSAQALGPTISCIQQGTGFAAGGVYNLQITNMKVRSDVVTANGFEQFANTNIGIVAGNTNRVLPGSVTWQAFAGISRFAGDWTFLPIPGQARFSISGVNTASLSAIGYGGIMPMKITSTGDWIPFRVPATGIATSGLGPLTPATSYSFYLYNSAASGFPYVGSIEVSATVPAVGQQGYSTKSGDTTRTFIGSATTDGSGNFQAAGVQSSWYPPGTSVAISSLSGLGTGVATTLGINIGSAGGILTQGAAVSAGATTITSASSTALTVGPNGATNPVLTVDGSAATQIAGLRLVGAATGATVNLLTTDSGANNNLAISAKGSGTIGIGTVSSGAVTITPALILGSTINSVTLDNNAWTSYVPTVTSGTGTPTTLTNVARYKQIGKTVFVEADVIVNAVGTAAGVMNISLPFTGAAFRYSGTAVDYGLSLDGGSVFLNTSATVAVVRRFDANTFWSTGAGVAISITYEVP